MGGGLKAKMLGLPAWGWIAIAAAAGIGIALYLQSRRNSASTGGAVDPSVTADSGSDNADVQNEILKQVQDLQGAASTPTTGTATTTLPAPTGLHFTSCTTMHAQIAWTPVSGAVSYVAEWQDRTGRATTAPFTAGTGHSYKLNKGDTVEVRVSAVDSGGVKGASTSASSTVK